MEIIEIGENNWVFSDSTLSQTQYEMLDNAIESWHEGSYDLAETLLKELVIQSPSNIDAFHHLSLLFDETSRELEAYLCCQEAVRIGLSAFTNKFSWKKSVLEWGSLDNRPFMRAYHNLGLWHQRRNEIDLAISVFSNLLSVCPNDNLGIRYLLPKLWFIKGDVLSVIRHCKKFDDDISPEIIYNYPLAFILSGELSKAEKLLLEAKQQLPLVVKELIKKRHPKPKTSMAGYITLGGADQAYSYWQEYGNYWKDSKRAMKLLNKIQLN